MRHAVLLPLLLLAFACGGGQVTPSEAGKPRAGTSVIVVDQRPPQARLAFGSLALLMTRAEVSEAAARKGWSAAGAVPSDGAVNLTPPTSDPAVGYGVRLEAGKVIQLSMTFRKADPERVSMRHDYARSKVQSDGSWAMTDAMRTTLVVIQAGGTALVATHLTATKDKAGAQAMLHRYLRE